MRQIIERFPEEIVKKAVGIKAIVTDVDGVLTDGGIIYDDTNRELKKFNVKDGQIIHPLRENGIIVAAITGRNSEVVKRRLTELSFDYHVHGKLDKLNYIKEIASKFNLLQQEICYLGDDLTDMSCLAYAGLSVCPYDALSYVKMHADYVTDSKGGDGVLREIADLILASQEKLTGVIDKFASRDFKSD